MMQDIAKTKAQLIAELQELRERFRLEQEQAEKGRTHERQLLRTVLDILPISVYVKDLQGRKILVNRGDLEIVGLSEEDVLGKTDAELFPPDVAEKFRKDDESVLSSGKAIQNCEELCINQSQGKQFWQLTSKVPLYDHDGKLIGLVGIGVDITERKQVEEELNKSRALFHSLVESIPHNVLSKDIAGRFTFANRQHCLTDKKTLDEIVGKTDFELYPPELATQYRADDIHVMESGQIMAREELHQVDGENFYVEVIKAPIHDDNNQVTGVIGIFWDITERKRMQDTIQKSRNMLHQVLDTIPQRVFWKDRTGYYLGCNMPFARSVGQGHPNQVVGKTDFELEDLPQRAKIYQEDDRIILENNRPKHHVIECIQQPDGSQQWLDSTKIPLMDEAGNPFAILGVFEDITDRKQAEEEILSRAERHRVILDTAMSGFWLADMQGRLLEVNQAYCEMSAYSAEELLSMHISKLDDLECADDTAAHIQKLIANGHDRFETRHRRKDGTVFDVEVSAQYHPFGDGRIVVFLQDITERKQTEAQLRLQSLVLAQIQDRVTVTNLDGVITYVNEAELQALGYAHDELIGASIEKYGEDAEHGATQHEILEKTLANGYWRGEVINQTADGKCIVLDCRTQTVVNDEGKTIALCGISTDITEMKRKEAILKAQIGLGAYAFKSSLQELMQKVLDEAETLTDSKVGFFHLVDEDGNAILLQAWSTNTLATMCTMDAANLHYPVEEAGIWAEAVRDGRPHIYNDYVGHPLMRGLPEGHTMITRFISMPILQNDKVLAILGVGNKAANYDEGDIEILNQLVVNVIEIFLRKRAEDALRANEERLRLALGAANQGLYDLNLKTGEATINEEYARMLGYEISELQETNEKWLERLHPDEREQVKAIFDEYVSGKLPQYRVEFRQHTKTGEWKWVLSLGKILEYDLNGNPTRMLGTYTDITERKRVEENLRESEKRLRTMLDISLAMSATLEMNTVLQNIVKNAADFIGGFSSAAIYTLKGDELFLEATEPPLPHGFPTELRRADIRKHPHVQSAVSSGATVILLDTTTAKLSDDEKIVVDARGLRSIAYIPLMISEKAIGVLIVASVNELRVFSDEEIALYEGFAGQAAQTIENIRLYQSEQEYASRLETQIAERRQAEDALRERESLLRIAGQTAQFGGWNADLTTQQVIWSEQVALIHDKEPGYSPDIHDGIKFYAPEWQAKITRVFNACAQDGTPYDEEMEIITARERRVWVRTIGHPVRDGSGKIIDVQGSFQDITERKNSEHDLAAAYDSTLRGWSAALELREHETGGHSRRVVEITLELARKMGVEEEKIIHIQRGALLHDIGKMGIPDSILLKPGPLSDDEWVTMRQHPEFAYRMLAKIDYLKPALEIPYCHHEKWDGSGYPRGLKGEEIPLAARIFAIVDTWDALSHDRPYRLAWPREVAVEHLKKQSGRQFDPQIVARFIELLESESMI
jgi:PAS domain S-box-containing protein